MYSLIQQRLKEFQFTRIAERWIHCRCPGVRGGGTGRRWFGSRRQHVPVQSSPRCAGQRSLVQLFHDFHDTVLHKITVLVHSLGRMVKKTACLLTSRLGHNLEILWQTGCWQFWVALSARRSTALIVYGGAVYCMNPEHSWLHTGFDQLVLICVGGQVQSIRLRRPKLLFTGLVNSPFLVADRFVYTVWWGGINWKVFHNNSTAFPSCKTEQIVLSYNNGVFWWRRAMERTSRMGKSLLLHLSLSFEEYCFSFPLFIWFSFPLSIVFNLDEFRPERVGTR